MPGTLSSAVITRLCLKRQYTCCLSLFFCPRATVIANTSKTHRIIRQHMYVANAELISKGKSQLVPAPKIDQTVAGWGMEAPEISKRTSLSSHICKQKFYVQNFELVSRITLPRDLSSVALRYIK